MDERSYWLGFSAFSGIGPARFAKLLSFFGSAKAAWEASLGGLKNAHIGDTIVDSFVAFRSHFSISSYKKALEAKHIRHITLRDKDYPSLLSTIQKPPIVLYVKGVMPLDMGKAIALVGTRKPTSYGQEVTAFFTKELVAAGCVIVSGLALGIDAIAHQTTLTNEGKTVAVLGCGVDCVYPRQNTTLYQEIIAKGGAVVSEMPPGRQPTIGSFPSRNRIIAGLSQAVLVTEGTVDSGSLITAEESFKNNRPVFAVPGPVTSMFSKGPHHLIEKGAQLVVNPQQILARLGIDKKDQKITKAKQLLADTKEEQQILDMLQSEPLYFDELVRQTKLGSSELGSLLSLLEIKGLVVSLDAGLFSLAEA